MLQRPNAVTSNSLLLAAAFLCAGGSFVAWFLFFTLYWPYRTRFNEEGRYVDEATLVVYHEQTGVLAIPALVLLLLAVLFGFFHRARRRAIGARRCV